MKTNKLKMNLKDNCTSFSGAQFDTNQHFINLSFKDWVGHHVFNHLLLKCFCYVILNSLYTLIANY